MDATKAVVPATDIQQLPPELLDIIFGTLPGVDLQSCALVCRWWKPFVCPRLFERVLVPEHIHQVGSFDRFVESVHLFAYVKELSLHLDGPREVEIFTVAELLTRLPLLDCLRLQARLLICSPERIHDTSNIPAIKLRMLNLHAKLPMDESSVYSLFRLFGAVDDLTLNYKALHISFKATHPLVHYKKLCARRLTVHGSPGAFIGMRLTRTETVDHLRCLVDPESLEYLDDSLCESIIGVTDDRTWPALQELRLGSKYRRSVEGSFYPRLQSLYLGKVCIDIFPDGTIESPRWSVLAQTLMHAPPSLEEFAFGITFGFWSQTEPDPNFLDIDILVRILHAMDWSVFASAIDAHPLLRKGRATVQITPGTCPDPNSVLEAVLNRTFLPLPFPDSRAQRIFRFSVS